MLPGDAEEPLKRLHHRGLACTIDAYECRETGREINRQRLRTEASEIDQIEPLNEHIYTTSRLGVSIVWCSRLMVKCGTDRSID